MNISNQKKKRAGRIVYIFLAVIVAFAMMMPHMFPQGNTAHAADMKLKKTKIGYYYGNHTHEFEKYVVNGKTCFCVQLHVSAYSGHTYSKGSFKKSLGISDKEWEQLNRIANIGYNSKRDSNAWYCATQMYIWGKLIDWKAKGNAGSNFTFLQSRITVPGYSDKKATITKELKEMNSALAKKPSFNEKTIKINQGEEQSFKVKDKNKVLAKDGYKVTSKPEGVTAKISGNTLVISTTKNAKKGKVNVGYVANKAIGERSFFYNPTSQNMSTLGKMPLSNNASVKLAYEAVETTDFDFKKDIALNDESDYSLLNDDGDIDMTKIKFAIYADEDITVGGKVKYEEEDKVAEASCDEDGNVSFEDLYPGRYYIKEIDAAPGLTTSDKEYKVIVAKDETTGKLEATADGSAWDEEGEDNVITDKPTTVELSKTDITGENEVPGAVMRLADENDETVIQWTSTDEPYVIEGLEVGKSYSLYEDAAPAGYVKDPSAVTFTVDDTGNVQRHAMDDKQVVFYKTDEDGKILSGASFKVIDKDGKTIEEFKGDFKDEGKIISSDTDGYPLSGLTKGETYTIKETDSPAAYQKAKDLTFKVEDDNKEQVISMIDKKIKIKTTAAINGLHVALNSKDTKEIDAVEGENYNIGQEYTLKSKLMFTDGTPVTIDGKEVTAETTFTPDKENFTQEVTFNYDASKLEGKSVVAFEYLYTKGELAASHEDLGDKDQTVRFMKIKTTATDVNTDSHVGKVDKETTIKDVVPYENAALGYEYTVVGTLMYKDTGKAVVQNGKEVTATAKFTPTSKDGSVELIFNVDSTLLKGKTTVAFEHVYVGDVEVASHSDLESEEQSVHFSNIHTEATANGKHTIFADGKVTLVDKITYINLIAPENSDKEFTAKLTWMDRKTGKPVKINGKTLTGEVTFVPSKANGNVTVKTENVDASNLAGKDLVAFEKIYYGDTQINSHEDINDKGQTIHFKEGRGNLTTEYTPNEGGGESGGGDSFVKTGDAFPYMILIAVLIASGVTAYVFYRRKRSE